MAKLVLHIGTHKTATTTIQDTFWTNAELLEEHGVIYPRLGRTTGHHGLVMDWAALPEVYRLPDGSAGTLRKLAETWGDKDVTVVLSSEELSRGDPRSLVDFSALRAAAEGFDQIEVLCVLRAQWQFLQSIYLERSKTINPPRPPEYVEKAIKTGMVEGLWIDYTKLYDTLAQSFAAEEITLMDFGTASSAEGGILGSVLAHLGCDLPAEDLAPVNNGRSNVSPMSLGTWAANVLADPLKAPDWLIDMTTSVLKNQYGEDIRPCLFTREEFAQLEHHFVAQNQTLYERLPAHLSDFRISGMGTGKYNLFRQRINGEFWQRCSRRLTQRALQPRHNG